MANGTLDSIMNKLADVYYPVGHYVITNTNTNPNNLGIKGTWELKHKQLSRNINNLIGQNGTLGNFFTANTTNFTLGGYTVRTDGSVMYLRLYGKNKVTLNDTAVTIGTLNYDLLGTDITCYWSYVHGQVNANNVILMVTVQDPNASNGAIVQVTDIVTNTSGTTSFAAQTSDNIFIQIPIHMTSNSLLYNDNVCTQFFWLRTA